jgi:malate dehydrogenase (oxaloacetate-decarboxylating)
MRDVEIARRVLCLDSRGLILQDRTGLEEPKGEIAADPAVAAGWLGQPDGSFSLLDVIREFRPTILVGASGQAGAFTHQIVKAMHRGCARPIVFPLSNPTSHAEARPQDVLGWTKGAAIVATGSPFPPVSINGVTHYIGQCNNAFVFPGVGLGAAVVGARWLPDNVFAAAATAVYRCTRPAASPGALVYPPVTQLRQVAHAVAVAVGRALVTAEAAPKMSPTEIERRVSATMWEPVYRRYVAHAAR